MDSEGSLLCLQEPATGPYPEPRVLLEKLIVTQLV